MSRRKKDILQYPNERVSIGDTFRCRKCRTYLFSFNDLTSLHKKIEPVDQCSAWYLTCDDDGLCLSLVQTAIDESNWTEGKLYCPKCTSRIGAFNITQGVKCSCYAHIVPAVWIQKSKVDQVTLSDMKPNIRLPRWYDEHQGDNNGDGNISNLPKTGKTSQTGSQSGQSGSDSCQAESQDNQTGSHNYQTRLQADSQTEESGLETSQSRSQHLPFGLQSIETRSYNIQNYFGNNQARSHDMKAKFHVIPTGSNNIGIDSKQLQFSLYSQTGYTEPQTGLSTLSQCSIDSTQTSQTGFVELNNAKPGPSGLCICNKNSNTNLLYCQEFSQECTICHGCVLFHSLNNFQHIEQGTSHNENLNSTQFCSQWHGRNTDSAIPACTWETVERNSNNMKDRDNDSSINKRNKQTVRNRKKQRKPKDYGYNTDDDMDAEYDGNRLTRRRSEQGTEENENIPEHLICPICLDLLYEPLLSPCDHVFCDTCLRILNSKSRKNVPRCPLCRKSLNYVYPAVELRDEIRKTHPELYRKRHRVERRAPHRRLPLPSGKLKSRLKGSDSLQEVPMPYSVLIFLVCVLAVCVLCLVILFIFCPPTSNHCVTVIGYE